VAVFIKLLAKKLLLHDLMPGNEFGRLGKERTPMGLNQVYGLAAVVDSSVVLDVEFELITVRPK
jgi:hypothetical protein